MKQFSEELIQLQNAHLLRTVKTFDVVDATHLMCDGRAVVNFASNDYLGLSCHPVVTEAAAQAVRQHGLGGGASRLISGTHTEHTTLEQCIARFKGAEAAIVFPTGYMTNVGVITALVGAGDRVVIDKLSHASIIDACRMTEAELRVFPHRNYERLEKILAQQDSHTQSLIITDSVFSMDGDRADLKRLVALKKKYGARLMIDEAHATGVFGDHGRGLAAADGVEGEIDIMMGTLSKALGALGGFVAGSSECISFLQNKARSFIYTTALPPAVCAGAEAAITLIEQDDTLREQLWHNIENMCAALKKQGIVIDEPSPIIPIIVGASARAMQVSESLFEEGLYVPAVRYPTVPKDKARLRISVSALHTEAEIKRLCAMLKEVASRE